MSAQELSHGPTTSQVIPITSVIGLFRYMEGIVSEIIQECDPSGQSVIIKAVHSIPVHSTATIVEVRCPNLQHLFDQVVALCPRYATIRATSGGPFTSVHTSPDQRCLWLTFVCDTTYEVPIDDEAGNGRVISLSRKFAMDDLRQPHCVGIVGERFKMPSSVFFLPQIRSTNSPQCIAIWLKMSLRLHPWYITIAISTLFAVRDRHSSRVGLPNVEPTTGPMMLRADWVQLCLNMPVPHEMRTDIVAAVEESFRYHSELQRFLSDTNLFDRFRWRTVPDRAERRTLENRWILIVAVDGSVNPAFVRETAVRRPSHWLPFHTLPLSERIPRLDRQVHVMDLSLPGAEHAHLLTFQGSLKPSEHEQLAAMTLLLNSMHISIPERSGLVVTEIFHPHECQQVFNSNGNMSLLTFEYLIKPAILAAQDAIPDSSSENDAVYMSDDDDELYLSEYDELFPSGDELFPSDDKHVPSDDDEFYLSEYDELFPSEDNIVELSLVDRSRGSQLDSPRGDPVALPRDDGKSLVQRGIPESHPRRTVIIWIRESDPDQHKSRILRQLIFMLSDTNLSPPLQGLGPADRVQIYVEQLSSARFPLQQRRLWSRIDVINSGQISIISTLPDRVTRRQDEIETVVRMVESTGGQWWSQMSSIVDPSSLADEAEMPTWTLVIGNSQLLSEYLRLGLCRSEQTRHYVRMRFIRERLAHFASTPEGKSCKELEMFGELLRAIMKEHGLVSIIIVVRSSPDPEARSSTPAQIDFILKLLPEDLQEDVKVLQGAGVSAYHDDWFAQIREMVDSLSEPHLFLSASIDRFTRNIEDLDRIPALFLNGNHLAMSLLWPRPEPCVLSFEEAFDIPQSSSHHELLYQSWNDLNAAQRRAPALDPGPLFIPVLWGSLGLEWSERGPLYQWVSHYIQNACDFAAAVALASTGKKGLGYRSLNIPSQLQAALTKNKKLDPEAWITWAQYAAQVLGLEGSQVSVVGVDETNGIDCFCTGSRCRTDCICDCQKCKKRRVCPCARERYGCSCPLICDCTCKRCHSYASGRKGGRPDQSVCAWSNPPCIERARNGQENLCDTHFATRKEIREAHSTSHLWTESDPAPVTETRQQRKVRITAESDEAIKLNPSANIRQCCKTGCSKIAPMGGVGGLLCMDHFRVADQADSKRARRRAKGVTAKTADDLEVDPLAQVRECQEQGCSKPAPVGGNWGPRCEKHHNEARARRRAKASGKQTGQTTLSQFMKAEDSLEVITPAPERECCVDGCSRPAPLGNKYGRRCERHATAARQAQRQERRTQEANHEEAKRITKEAEDILRFEPDADIRRCEVEGCTAAAPEGGLGGVLCRKHVLGLPG